MAGAPVSAESRPRPFACGLAGCLRTFNSEDAVFHHRDLDHPGWDDDFTPAPPPAEFRALFPDTPRPDHRRSDPGDDREQGGADFLSLLRDAA